MTHPVLCDRLEPMNPKTVNIDICHLANREENPVNLKDFERRIDPLILTRGRQIQGEGLFSGFVCEGDTFSMIAHGTSDYETSVTIDEDLNVTDHECSCPYDYGPVCKHVVALLYLARESMKGTNGIRMTEHQEDRLPMIVSSIDKETLEEIVLRVARRDSDLKKELIYSFDDDDHKIGLARSVTRDVIEDFREIVNDYWVDDNAWDEIRNPVDDTLSSIECEEDTHTAVRMTLSVIEELKKGLSFDDDFLPNLIADAFSTLLKVIRDIPDDDNVRCQVFHAIDDDLKRDPDNIDDYCAGEMIMAMAQAACPTTQDDFLAYLESLAHDHELSPWLKDRVEIATHRHLCTFRPMSVSKDYLLSHQDNDTLFAIAYSGAMDEGDFGLAVRLASEALDRYGTSWQKTRYEKLLVNALMEAGRGDEAKPYLKDHALAGDADACTTYLGLLDSDERATESNALMDAFMDRGARVNAFRTVACLTGDTDRLMAFAELHPEQITALSDIVSKAFPERTLEVYERLVMELARHATNRRAYRDIASLIRQARRELGQVADKIKHRLVALYPRKHALKDELS
jgi:hypothetical protein